MKNIDQVLDEIYPTLQSLEQDRQAYKSKQKTCIWAVLFPGFAIAGVVAYNYFPIGIAAVVVWLIASFVIYYFMAGKAGDDYVSNYKETVIEKLVTVVDPNLHYDRNQGIDRDSFSGSELFSTRPDRYSTEDLIYGDYGKTSLSLAEINAEERRQTTDSDGKTKTTYVTIFKGLLLVADFHKNFNGRTFVFPDFAEKTFGGLGRAFQKLSGRRGTSLVQMEDVEFEKLFAVHSTDQIEARYILSPGMMRRMIGLTNKFGEDVRIAFKDSSVWIAVPHTRPYLEPNMASAATDQSQLEEMLSEIASFIELVEELDLNTRIWTKE